MQIKLSIMYERKITNPLAKNLIYVLNPQHVPRIGDCIDMSKTIVPVVAKVVSVLWSYEDNLLTTNITCLVE